jgi:hypothetical protein
LIGIKKGMIYFEYMRKYLYICSRNITFKVFISMGKKLISESEIKRISQLSESMMIQESQSWRPSQWAAYLSKGNTFDDTELDRYIEEEIIER